jgi:CDP-glycerol glycerophosphotransferase (TagB/SpsB family)
MPTYRNLYGEKLERTEYYRRWNSLINNKQLIKYIEKNNITIYFYLHNRMHKYIDYFNSKSKNIIIAKDNNINDLIKESSLLVTDYSSVYMDFAYMLKPVIYYQFDYKNYRKTLYKEGYYKYSKDAFGKILLDEEDVVKKIIAYVTLNYKLEDVYLNKMNNFFGKKDSLNSERIYMAIEELGD